MLSCTQTVRAEKPKTYFIKGMYIRQTDKPFSDPQRNVLSDSESGRVPEKYLIVRNNDLIANRYLLVYGDKNNTETESDVGGFGEAATSREDARERRQRAPERPGWIWENKGHNEIFLQRFLCVWGATSSF